MAAHQVVLKLSNLLGADMNVGEFAEAGGDAVDGAVFGHNRIDDRPRLRHLFRGRRMELHAPPIESDFMDVFDRETLAVNQQRIHTTIIASISGVPDISAAGILVFRRGR